MSFLLSKKIRYFITVMDVKNLSIAAEQLHITRSPLGKAITDLELTIGNKLFIRKGNSLSPTEVAIHLYRRLKPIYESLISLENSFSGNRKANQLRIYVDERYPRNLFDLVTSLRYMKNYNIKVEKKPFNESTLAELTNDPKAAFLTLRENHLQLLQGYSFTSCAQKKVYFIYANNQKNQNKSIKEILSNKVVIKDSHFSDEYYLNFLSSYFEQTDIPPRLLNDEISLTSILNLIVNDQAVTFISHPFLKFCSGKIACELVENFSLTPKLLCRDSNIANFEVVLKAINDN